MRPHSAPYSAHMKRLQANPVRIRSVRRWTKSARGELHCCLEANGKHFERSQTISMNTLTLSKAKLTGALPASSSSGLFVFSQTKALVQYTVNVHSRIRKKCAAFKSGDIIDNKHDRCAVKKTSWILTTCCSSHWVRKRLVTWRGCRQQQNHVLYCV